MRTKPHRLPESAYIGRRAVSFTACTVGRTRGLNDPRVATAIISSAARAAQEFGCIVPLYTVMPDHLHIVILGLHDSSKPKEAMTRLKQQSGYWLAQHRPGLVWQDDFYDTILRRSRSFAASLRYIALNPVRAGLAEHIHDYPYTGSIGCDLNEVLTDAFWDR